MVKRPRSEQARSDLRGALLCHFDHPLAEWAVVGGEIDRRLAQSVG